MEPIGTLGVTGFKNNFLSFKNLIFKKKFFFKIRFFLTSMGNAGHSIFIKLNRNLQEKYRKSSKEQHKKVRNKKCPPSVLKTQERKSPNISWNRNKILKMKLVLKEINVYRVQQRSLNKRQESPMSVPNVLSQQKFSEIINIMFFIVWLWLVNYLT